MPKELFKLIGLIGTSGVEKTKDELKSVDKLARDVSRSFGRTSKQAQKLGKSLTKFLTVPIAAAGVALYKGANAASDLREEQSKANEVFGESSKAISAWAGTAAKAFGQSKVQATAAASTFGMFGKAAGLSGDNLAGFSTKFVELASDLASFNNTTPEEAITAIGAALRGEAEPIRKYNVLLNDATLRQKALSMGLIATTKNALTPQQKVLAASAVIMDQTTTAQGDFSRTSDELANSKRKLAASVANAAANVGTLLLPAVLNVTRLFTEKLLPAVNKAVDWFKDLSPNVQKTVFQLVALAAAVGPVLMITGKLILAAKTLVPLFKALAMGQNLLNIAMNANPIGLIITGIAALVAAGVILYNNWDAIKKMSLELWDTIAYGAAQAVSYVKQAFAKLATAILDGYGPMLSLIPPLKKVIDKARDSMAKMAETEALVRSERRLSRIETKKQALANKELKQAVEGAKSVALDYKIAQQKLTGAKKEDTAATTEQMEAEKKLADERARLQGDYAGRVREATFSRLELLAYEKTEAIKQAKTLGADVSDINKYYDLEEQRIEEEERSEKEAQDERELQKQREKREKTIAIAVDAVDTLFEIGRKATANKIAELDIQRKREIRAIEASTMGEVEKQAAIEAVNQKADRKKAQLMTKQAKRDKAAAVFATVVSSIQAVAKALTLGPPVGFVMAAIMGVLGAIQVGLVASKPIPKFASGAMVKGGRGGVTAEVGEGRESELVMPLETGVNTFIDNLFSRMRGQRAAGEAPVATLMPEPQAAPINVHVGTLIADDLGVKDFGRRLRPFLISDNQRLGMAGA